MMGLPTEGAKGALILGILGVILGAVLYGYIGLWWGERDDIKNSMAPIQAKVSVTDGINKDAITADQMRTEVNKALSQARATFNRNYQEAKQHEPTVFVRATAPVPMRVRDAFRERRLSRERSGCVGNECRSRPAASDPAQR